eukprot:TRINITY_DN13644_c0_g1_i1.p1 TRINITY_DN13644_c0_g1~~TRINITY_DN13644_c0_g1_i1.p1  ORF type:complete len:443 (+),score=202.13 TRINITY_DN13644_c0_g1_i1:58-1386(+)
MSDEEYVYEDDDDEYMSDDGDDCMEEGDDLEGMYYDAKDKIDDEPEEAADGFMLVLEREDEMSKWCWKAMKRLVRVYCSLQRYADMVQMYGRLLEYEWSGRTRNDTEKAINKLLDVMANVEAETLASVHEITTKYVGTGLRNEKLWFSVKMKAAQALLDVSKHAKCQEALDELKDACRAEDKTQWDKKKGTQLMMVFATEIQLCEAVGNLKRLKHLYEEAMLVEGAIPPPRITGIIREAGGKMYMQQEDFEQANEAFFQAFKHYDEAGHPRRVQCLKYLVLANMMSRSKINPFDSPEALPYKSDPEIGVMTGLIDAANQNDIDTFERILKDNQAAVTSDPLIKKYLSPLLRTVRTQVLQLRTKAYTTVRLSYLAEDLGMHVAEVEELLVSMLLDDMLKGGIDQVNGTLTLGSPTKDQSRYLAIQKWAAQVSALHSAIGSRLH